MLHPRNKHRARYDFKALCASEPELTAFVRPNAYGDESIDFSNPEAVKTLNRALLKHHYGVSHWEIPQNYLCPPIPGRADYLHHVADLLAENNGGKIPTGSKVKCLDVGVGANCIYPIVGNSEYQWSFVGSDIDPVAVDSAHAIVKQNEHLRTSIDLRLQRNKQDFFFGILRRGERFSLTVCNPPFHSSAAEAEAGTIRKLSNLNRKKVTKATLNFGGTNNELWCEGGELQFVRDMIHQSRRFSASILWFTTLVSKEANLRGIYRALKKAEVTEVKTIPMGQGNKVSRIVAWTFHSKTHQQRWAEREWGK